MGSGLTNEQKNLILGTLLGDGTIEKEWRNPRLRIAHSLTQKEYLFWKYDILRSIAAREPYIVKYKKHHQTGRIYSSWYFSTRAIPELDFYYQLFYQDGRKVISENLINHFNQPLSLAVWLMDDGYKRNDCNALRFSTDAFSYEEQLILQKCLGKNFGISSKLHRKGCSWNIYIPTTEMSKVHRLIDEHITPSMKYKLPPRNDLIRNKLNRIAIFESL